MICCVDNWERALHYLPVGTCHGCFFFVFFWHFTAYRAFARLLIGTDFQARLDYVACPRDFVSAYDWVKRALHFDLYRWQPAHTRYPFILFLRSDSEGFGVILSVLRFLGEILGYSDHWLARNACRQRVSLLPLLSLLSPCMSEWLCFLELLHGQAYVFTSLSFGGGGACYGLISAQITNLMVIKT